MNSLDLTRRRVLLSGSLGVAIGAIPTMRLEARDRETSATHEGLNLGIFDVRRYGAIGDGKTLDTDAVNRAIEAAATAGGGTVVFPP